MITARFMPQKTTDSMLSSLKQGISFVRQQGAMEALIVLAFCMTALEHADADLLPGLRQGHLPSRTRDVTVAHCRMGIGSICGSLVIASTG